MLNWTSHIMPYVLLLLWGGGRGGSHGWPNITDLHICPIHLMREWTITISVRLRQHLTLHSSYGQLCFVDFMYYNWHHIYCLYWVIWNLQNLFWHYIFYFFWWLWYFVRMLFISRLTRAKTNKIDIYNTYISAFWLGRWNYLLVYLGGYQNHKKHWRNIDVNTVI